MSSRVEITSFRPTTLALTKSWALFSQTSVPWESPAILTNSAKVVGFVSTSICLVNFVPNSGMAIDPTVVPSISSGSIPRAFVEVNRDIVAGSSRGISVILIPVISSSILIIVGPSCPRISSFKILPLIEW